ncbi:MAG: uroporphyrinogen decarboxylase family protein [Elusimicrobiota bacterium]
MNSKELVETVFNRQLPSRVPVFDQLIVSRVAGEILGRKAYTGGGEYTKDYYELLAKGERDFLVQRYAEDVVELYHNKLDYDIIPVNLIVPKKGQRVNFKKLDDNTYLFGDMDKSFSISKFSPDSGEMFVVDSTQRRGGVEHLRKVLEDNLKIYEEKKDVVYDPSVFEAMDYVVSKIGNVKSIAVPSTLSIPMDAAWWEALLLYPELIEKWLDYQLHERLAYMKAAKEHGADFVLGGGDIADNHGPVYSPELYRRMLQPRIKVMTSYCHELGLPYVYRTDGNTRLLWDDMLLNSGVDGYHEIDYQAGIRIRELKQYFGKRLVLLGNLDCATVLVSGTETEIAAAVKECMDEGKPGGCYILSSSNSLHYNVPACNVWHMVNYAKKYGDY